MVAGAMLLLVLVVLVGLDGPVCEPSRKFELKSQRVPYAMPTQVVF